MRMPHIFTHPIELFHVLSWCAVEFFAGVGNVVIVLGQMGVHPGSKGPCEFGRFLHQRLAHRKG